MVLLLIHAMTILISVWSLWVALIAAAECSGWCVLFGILSYVSGTIATKVWIRYRTRITELLDRLFE